MATCGNGQKRRRRFCNNPAPENGGTNCQGQEYDDNSCLLPACAGEVLFYFQPLMLKLTTTNQWIAKFRGL